MAFGEDYVPSSSRSPASPTALAADTAKTFRFFMRKGGMTLEERPPAARGEDVCLVARAAKRRGVVTWRTGDDAGGTRRLVETFKRTGFTGGINWYRNFTRNWQESEGLAQQVAVPCLDDHGRNDVVLRPPWRDGMEALVPDLRSTWSASAATGPSRSTCKKTKPRDC